MKKSIVAFLTVFGGTIMFISWIADTSMNKEWESKRKDYQETEANIANLQNASATYSIGNFLAANMYRNNPNDYNRFMLMQYNFKYVETEIRLTNQIQYQTRLLKAISNKELLDYAVVGLRSIKQAEQIRDEQNVDKMDSFKIKVMDSLEKAKAIHTSNRYYTQTSLWENQEKWNRMFVIFYVIGSLLLGCAYLVSHQKELLL